MDKIYSIAIDGPSGAGKSTISKAVAKKLGFTYIDTGAMYRAIGLKALRCGYNVKEDAEKITQMTADTVIDISYTNSGQLVFTDGEDVTGLIRTPEISMAASAVSAIAGVRVNLVKLQQSLAESKSVIMDGRDIATKVLPNADVKIFLTASSEARAKRRYAELLEKGENVTFEEVFNDIEKRDYNDSHRAASPLKCAEDAILVDTTEKNLEESIDFVTALIKESVGIE